MARPCCQRRVQELPKAACFKPAGIACDRLPDVLLGIDEMEALRLADWEGLYQEEAAVKMQISRATFGRILETARKKVADALVHGKSLYIEGGHYIMNEEHTETCPRCGRVKGTTEQSEHKASCPHCGGGSENTAEKGRCGHGHDHGEKGHGGCRCRKGRE